MALKFEEKVIGTIMAIVIIAIFYGIFKFEQYKYNDCKKVGHGTFYCIFKIGK